MKTKERQHLKQNEFATRMVALANTAAENRQRILPIVLVIVLIVVALAGFTMWRQRAREAGTAMLGQAMSIAQSPIVPAPTLPGATQAPGTYPSLEARNEAALKLFQEVATQYEGTDAGRAASYHAAAALLEMGRAAEAETAFAESATRAGDSIYAPMSRLGRAEALAAQAKYDEAIALLTELSGDRDGRLPIDGVLMQLGHVSMKASKTNEARAAFKRVVDEFPDSPYVPEARQQLTVLG
jgi:TolA-binding protein